MRSIRIFYFLSKANITLFGDWGSDYLDGGDGFDIVDVGYLTSGFAMSWTIDLAEGTGTTSNFTEIILNVEGVIGSSLRDTILGDAGDNFIDGGAGQDSLFGGNGNDTITGNRGKDTLDGGDGFDIADIAIQRMGG